MLKRLEATYLGDKRIELLFSDGSHGVFDVRAYCAERQGPLLSSAPRPLKPMSGDF